MTKGRNTLQSKHNKDGKDSKEKKLNGVNFKLPSGAVKSLREIALHCFCEILVTHPHFNYRTNIISVVVPFMADKNPQLSDTVCQSIRTVFKEDRTGEVTLEITRLIGRMIKAKHFDIHPKVLNTFLSLKINEIDNLHKRDKKAPKKKSDDMSRHERKTKKQMRELERELEDAAFMDNKKKKIKLHTQIINMVFLTYFRILKQAQYSSLLSAVLEGLAKFAHLINVNFFDDLFSVLNDLVESADLTYRESLHCVKTAFIILSGQGSALNIDPLRFYRHLYGELICLHAGHSSEDVPLALECLDIMISKRRRQVSQQRFLAFAKRVTTLALQQESHGALGMLATTRHLLHAYPKTDVLLDTDSQGSGMYLPELDEPEHCNAHSTAFYELHTLRHHYHPTVKQYANHLLHGAPSQGVGQLMTQLSRKSPTALFEEYNSSEMNFNPSIDTQPKTTNKKARTYPDVLQPEIQELTKEALLSVQGIKLSSVDFMVPPAEPTVNSSGGQSSKLAQHTKSVKGNAVLQARNSSKDSTSCDSEKRKQTGTKKQTSSGKKKVH